MFKFPARLQVVNHPCYGTRNVTLACEVPARNHFLVKFSNGHLTLINADYLRGV